MIRILLLAATAVLLLTAPAFAQATLTWTDVATDESGYRVERAAAACTPVPAAFVVIAASLPASTTTYTDTTFVPGSTACYRVAAFNGAGASYSNLAQFSPPAAPTGLSVR